MADCSVAETAVTRLVAAAALCSNVVIFSGSGLSATSGKLAAKDVLVSACMPVCLAVVVRIPQPALAAILRLTAGCCNYATTEEAKPGSDLDFLVVGSGKDH